MANPKRFLKVIGFPLFIAATVALVVVFRHQFGEVLRNREALRTWVLDRGNLGLLAFLGLQTLQVVLFLLPGEAIQIAGGYIFGFWLGTFLSLIGIALGAVFNFYAGRLMGRPFVEGLFGAERTERLASLSSSPKAAVGLFVFFLVPGIPKDALCYVAGMARLGLPSFLLLSTLGRLPGIIGSSFMGSATQKGSYLAAFVVFGLASLLFILGVLFRARIEAAVETFLKGRG